MRPLRERLASEDDVGRAHVLAAVASDARRTASKVEAGAEDPESTLRREVALLAVAVADLAEAVEILAEASEP